MIIPGHSKNTKITVALVLLVLLVGFLYMLPKRAEGPDTKSLTQASQYFIEESQGRIVVEMGFPKNGFTPKMFLDVYPNLVSEDFNGAEVKSDTSGDNSSSFNEASLTTQGILVLLENVSKRSGIPTDTTDDIDSILQFMTVGKSTVYQQVSVMGQYVCLPKKDVLGDPQTTECALGVRSNDGKFYGMDTHVLQTGADKDLKTGDFIMVSGNLVPVEELSSANWQNYNIEGIIWVTTLVRQ